MAFSSLRRSHAFLRRGVAKISPNRPSTSSITTACSGMPPGFEARVGLLETFRLPYTVTGSRGDRALGLALVNAWRRDGILQVEIDRTGQTRYQEALEGSRQFFGKPYKEKSACVDSQSFAGYVASGEEMTDGVADYSEIFTVTKDLGPDDPRVVLRWPCHGSVPWPDRGMKDVMNRYMAYLGENGEKLLRLTEYGLGVPEGSLTGYTEDGWHHMRVLRFPPRHATNGKGKEGRGIGSHTDYGLLVIAAQNHVGGLFVRSPYSGETLSNWQKSSAGAKENDEGWIFIPPEPNVFTVFPGDMLQYMTNSYLPSTPHKVGLNIVERFAFAYFHEPRFEAVVRPLPGYNGGQKPLDGVHYGTHFTDMCVRNYPDRVTTQRLRTEDRCRLLRQPELRREMAGGGFVGEVGASREVRCGILIN